LERRTEPNTAAFVLVHGAERQQRTVTGQQKKEWVDDPRGESIFNTYCFAGFANFSLDFLQIFFSAKQ
jgi:hypothetical protein